MKEIFLINFRLPSLNDYITANRTNKHAGNKFKTDVDESIGWRIKQAKVAGNLTPKEEPVDILIDFYEPNRRRDVDNIQSATKYILDALVKQGILKNDGRKYVHQIYHRVYDIHKTAVKEKGSNYGYCIVQILSAGAVTLNIDN